MIPGRTLFWGDIHNHNEVGYGLGSIGRSYRIARGTLDFYAFTPHGWWPDLPTQDRDVLQRHLDGFAKVRDQWQNVVEQANAANCDGAFAAFVAYEWHSLAWGDYHILFPGSSGTLFAAPNLESLLEFVRTQHALAIPHHCAYALGRRGTRWADHDESVSPVCEIFSEHGNSFEAPSHWGMYGHSMGASCRTQTVIEQLKGGRIVGFTAGTDNHVGYPGAYGQGLTGVWAPECRRGSIFDALQRRHSIAVTGDRIAASLRLDDAIMGDVLQAAVPRYLRLNVEALDAIDYVELNKNGYALSRWTTDNIKAAATRSRLLRLEWGWDALASRDVTRWSIHGRIERGALSRVVPCFSGGPASVDDVNRVDANAAEFHITSHTSRANPLPTNSIVLDMDTTEQCRLSVRVSGEHRTGPFHLTSALPIEALEQGDTFLPVSGGFSVPGVRIGPALDKSQLALSAEFADTEPGPRDFYFVKVLQRNGHMAWTSPIWCR